MLVDRGNKLGEALRRCSKHEANEAKRMRAGIRLDLDRWIETGVALD